MEKTIFDLVVLGGGPGGVEAAVMAARQGLAVALVGNQKAGGRAVWGSLVPSKVWLKAAEAVRVMRHSSYYALGAQPARLDLENLRARIVAQSESRSKHYRDELKAAGVIQVEGKGIVMAPDTVQVETEKGKGRILRGRFIIIATGSEPVFAPDIRPVPPRIFAPRHTATLPELPKRLVIAGGGVTGVEYGFAFSTLGTKVVLLHNGPQLLPGLDPRVASHLEDFLHKSHGMHVHKNDAVKAVHLKEGAVEAETVGGARYHADYALLATGRAADLSFYDPAVISFDLKSGKALEINEFCQTSQPGVYAVGDVTGAPMVANRATMQARIAVTHLLHGDAGALRPKPFIEMTYTYPPVGQIGDMQRNPDSFFVEKPYTSLLKAHLEGDVSGFVRIKVHDHTGLIAGAAAFGQQAPELLGLVQLAMHHGISYHKLRSFPLAHPSYGELLTAL